MQENEAPRRSRASLHDEVGQSLSALLVGLSNLSAAVPDSAKAELQVHVEGIRDLAQNSVRVVRNLALLLRPSMLDDLGLVPALEWQAREVSRTYSIRVNVAADDVSDNLPEDHKTCIYRVVQEALHNAVRHSGATAVRITVKQGPEDVSVLVQDDGRGFRPEVTRGLGLLGIEERVATLGGTFRIDSHLGRGTLGDCLWPLTDAEFIMSTMKILLADDTHVVMRRGILVRCSSGFLDFQVVAEAADGREVRAEGRGPLASRSGR